MMFAKTAAGAAGKNLWDDDLCSSTANDNNN